MNPFLKATVFAAVLCVSIHSNAQEKAEATTEPTKIDHRNVLIELQAVVIPQKTAIPIIKDLMNPEKAAAAYDQVHTLIGDGTAKLIAWPMLTTKSGSRATSEDIQEYRYPTEFEPSGVGIYLEEKDGKYAKTPGEITGLELPAIPKAFETRNIGVTLEVEPTISADGKMIDMSLAPQHVRLKAMNKVTLENGKSKVVIEQPEFVTFKVSTTLTVRSGEWKLLGIYTPSEPKEHLELFIIKAEIQNP